MPEDSAPPRRRAHGVELSASGASFRVWAQGRRRVTLALGDGSEHDLAAGADGWFSGHVQGLGPGTRYGFRLDGGDALPDPASRSQPDGPDELSEVVDPAGFAWTDAGWTGVGAAGQVISEIHVGTFTAEGTWIAAAERLAHLADVGITLVELMPVGEFRGRFGWGYDGTLPCAPTRLYGTPDAFRSFVDAAHAHGLGVILDVVFNHFGPGNRFADFSEDWFTNRYENEWGRAPNFDGPHSGPVRSYVTENVAYWIEDFHLDGLRIDATQALHDASDDHIVAAMARAAREAAGGRRVVIIAENEPQDPRLARPAGSGGSGLDALWNDDFHHSARVALTGRSEAYYHDHRGAPQEFVAAAKFGHLFQGQRYDWQDAPRGGPSRDLPATSYVNFLENHDQVANSARGARGWADGPPARMRALTALLLLAPQTPMLFQGQEFGSSRPFFYFADQGGDLDRAIAEGRAAFLAQFPSLQDGAAVARLAAPAEPETFARCKLDWGEAEANAEAVRLHRDLLRLRRETPAIARQPSGAAGGIDGAVIGPGAFLLRYFGGSEEERLLLVNLGPDLRIASIPDPLFAPPAGLDWHLAWSSEDPAYGGDGRRAIDPRRRFVLPADSASLLAPGPRRPSEPTADLNAWQDQIG